MWQVYLSEFGQSVAAEHLQLSIATHGPKQVPDTLGTLPSGHWGAAMRHNTLLGSQLVDAEPVLSATHMGSGGQGARMHVT
jgi:hypothetical protein